MERVEVDFAQEDPELREARVAFTSEEVADREELEAESATAQATREGEITSETTLRDRAETSIATLEQAYAGWATLTAAQKDAALRLTVRVAATLARLVLRRLA
jgi:hypothetical protein